MNIQSNQSSKVTHRKTLKWSLKAGGLCLQVNLFLKSVSGTNKMWSLSTGGVGNIAQRLMMQPGVLFCRD
jgi:hypothetical protein